jgi:hypothetical protein
VLRNLISACWHQDPSQRPKFSQVVAKLRAIEISNVVEGMGGSGALGGGPAMCGCAIM